LALRFLILNGVGLAFVTSAGAAEPPALWQEGESFVRSPANVKVMGEKAPASDGMALYGLAFTKKDRTVGYEVTLPQTVHNARLVFRFARQFWKADIKAAVIPLELTGDGKMIRKEVTFGDTKGWGSYSIEWGLAEVEVGDLAAGKWLLKMTSPADESDVCLDGFFVAPPQLMLAAEEFAFLSRLRIGSEGYLGLRVCSGVLDQKAGRPLTVIVRNFSGEPGTVKVVLVKPSGETVELATAAEPKAEGTSGAMRIDFKYPPLSDGVCTLKITCSRPALTLEAPAMLAGELLAGLDERVARLEAFAKGLSQMDEVARRHQGDFDYAIEYLKTKGQDQLRHCAASAEDTGALAYIATTKMRAPEILLANVRNTLSQYEGTMARLKDHRDPDAGRIGDFRRSLDSKVKGSRVRYRFYVPKSYATAETTPLILCLHGANDDEDGMMAGEDGVILKLAERRGYMVLAPTYRRNEDGYMDYLLEVLSQVRAEYPKIDPSRIFAYGFSMGGNASSQIAAWHPEVFAAACPGGGLCDQEAIEKLRVPLRIQIGAEDPGITRMGSRVAYMFEHGMTLEVHVEPGLPHSCPAAKFMRMAMDFFDRYPKK
jgi:hypothetical protein